MSLTEPNVCPWGRTIRGKPAVGAIAERTRRRVCAMSRYSLR